MLNELRLFPLVAQRIPTAEADSSVHKIFDPQSTIFYWLGPLRPLSSALSL